LKAALWSAWVILLAVDAHGQWRILFERQTQYHQVIVAEAGNLRRLHFNNTVQSSMDPRNPLNGFMEYTDYVYCAFLFNRDIQDVLLIGLGGGSLPKGMLANFPNARMDVAEIDPVVVDVAREYFAMRDDPRLKVHVGDGRVFVKRAAKRYDLIILDAYSGSRYGLTVPRHLTTREFLQEIHDHLTPAGLLVYNIATDLGQRDSRMTRALARTAGVVFRSQYAWDVETSNNTILVALKSPQTLTRDQLVERARRLMEETRMDIPRFMQRVVRLRTEPYRTDDVPLLTDNYAPVDSLMRTR